MTSKTTCHRIAMRGPLPQSDRWSPTNESVYKSPKHFSERNQSQQPHAHNDARSTDYNHLSPSTQHAASAVPMLGYYCPLHDLAPYGMTVPVDLTSTSAAPPTHFQDVDYSHTHHPHGGSNINYSLGLPPFFQPAYVASHASQPVPHKPISQPEQNT